MLRLLSFPGYVALIIKVAKKHDEANAVCKHNCIHRVREVTFSKKVVAGVNSQKDKLDL